MAGKQNKETNKEQTKETGKETKTRQKRGGEAGQLTLDDKVKRVSFMEKEKEFKEKIEEEVRKIRQEALAMEKLKTEIKEKQLELIERFEGLEKRVKELEEHETERENQWRAEIESRLDERSGDGASRVSSIRGSTRSLTSGGSAESGQTGVSHWSRASFSDRDVMQMKRLLAEKEKTENRNVIAIKGLEINEYKEPIEVSVTKFFKEKLSVVVELDQSNVKMRGRVVVIRFKNANDKEVIMKNKSKLAGSKIFIEHYRSFEERKKQENLYLWAKEKKEKGLILKIGFGKVLYKDVWYRWEDVEKLEERIQEEEKKRNRIDNIEGKKDANERENRIRDNAGFQ